MKIKKEMANLLADNINTFVEFVYANQKKKSFLLPNSDKLHQVKLFVEEYRLQITADELHRINQFCWNEAYTILLVKDFQKALAVMDEYVERNYDDLFILTARLHTLKSLSRLFKTDAVNSESLHYNGENVF